MRSPLTTPRRHRSSLLVLACAAAVAVAGCSSSTTGGSSAAPSSPASSTPAAAPSSSAAAAALDTAATARIDEYAKATIGNGKGITGVIVGVHDPAKGDLLKAYGTSTGSTPMTTDMHYRIASVTKTFTAYAILKLLDEKKLSLDDTVSKYVADVPNGDAITLRNLLEMRSGLYDYASDPSITGRTRRTRCCPGTRSTRR